jgi:hypothetical protein
MSITIEQAVEHATDLVNDYYDQKEMMEDIDKMYFMDWEDKPKGKEFKFTTSPSARNALLGAIRLMTTTEPKFVVPFDANNDDAKMQSEKIEKLCKTIWYHSGRFRGVPLEQPAIESLLRYGMMCLAIIDTEDLRKLFLRKGASKAQERQLQRLVNSTPYLIEAWDPKGVYPEWGRFGLTAVYRKVEMTIAQVIEQFGEDVIREKIGIDAADMNEYVTYADYWNLEKHIAWISSTTTGGETIIAGEPICDEEHNLPCIPIVVQTSEGSYMDSDRQYQALPFLYGVYKSELWERQNLELTYMYTNLFHLAANPTFIHRTMGEGELIVDYATPGGRIVLGREEDYHMLQKDVINADMMQGLEIANKLVEDSTIYNQALGGLTNIGANAAFSTVSLLHQAGRLPLTSPQKRGGWGIGTAMELIFEMIKDKGKTRVAKSREGLMELDVGEIPDDLIIEATLDVDLPQDQLSQANIAQLITQSGLTSKRWAREKILNIGQSDEMEKEIWNEQGAHVMYQQTMQKMVQQQQMQDQMAMQQQMMAQGMPPGGMPPGMPPQKQEMKGPISPGSAMQTQAGLIPATRPGQKPVPPDAGGQPMQRGEGMP